MMRGKLPGARAGRFSLLALLSAATLALGGYLIFSLPLGARSAAGQDTSPPSRPRGVQAAAISSTQVEVHWIASVDNVGVAGYRIYRCPGDCPERPWPGAFVLVGTVRAATAFVDPAARPDTEYTYLVTAVDPAGNESEPGLPPKTPGFRPLMHDHQPHTLPSSYTARVEITYPASVAPGATFQIRRVLHLSPRMSIGHSDLHYRTDHDEPYRQWAFPDHRPTEDQTATVTAPPSLGTIFFYAETHLSWPGLVGTDDSPFCSPWFRIVVTSGDPLHIRPSSLPSGTAGASYRQTLRAAGEIPGPFRWGITHGGRLPPGLSIDSRTGTIAGTPTTAGTYAFTVLLEADSGAIATRQYSLLIQ